MSKDFSPFTIQDRDRLHEAQRALHDVLPMLDKAGACGVDCGPYKEICEKLQKDLDAIKTLWMDKLPVR